MIALKINGKIAELKPDTKISFTLNNPFFNEDNLSPGSYTLPFTLAGAEGSPLNSQIFKHPDVIENIESFISQIATIAFDGNDYKTGKLKASTITGTNINANFIFGLSALSDQIKTAKVRDIVSEDIVIDNSPVAKKIYLAPLGGAASPYQIIVNGRPYEGATLAELVTAINNDTALPRAVATLVGSGATPQGHAAPFIEIRPDTNQFDPLSPPAVRAEDNGSGATGYKWYAEAFNHAGYHAGLNAFLQPYFTGAYPDERLRFPFRFNGYTSQVFLAYATANYVNGLNSFGILYNNANAGANLDVPFYVENINSLQPFLRLRWVLDKIGDYLGFEWEGDWYSDPDTEKMLIDNAATLDVPMEFLGATPFNFYRRSFNLNELVPDMKVIDFLKALQNRYNLAIYQNELTGKVVMRKREAVAKAIEFDDVTNITSPIQEIEDLAGTGIRLIAELEKDDLFATTDQIVVGDAEDESKTDLSGLDRMWYPQDVRLVPVTTLSGPFVSRPSSKDFKFRIFYHLGQTSAGGSPDFNYDAASINAVGYTERFQGINGIYDTFWKRWITYQLNRRSIKVTQSQDFADLVKLDWSRKKRFDRNNYLVKSLSFDFTPQGLTLVKAELYSML